MEKGALVQLSKEEGSRETEFVEIHTLTRETIRLSRDDPDDSAVKLKAFRSVEFDTVKDLLLARILVTRVMT